MHHAYLLVGSQVEAQKFLKEFLSERGIEIKASPDFFPYTDSFGIDEARQVSITAVKKSFGREKIFFIAPEKIGVEAQNALLKTLEDPVPDTYFFLSVRDENLIIPTLRSRVQILRVGEELSGADAEKFLKLSVKDRLSFARKFADSEKNLSVFLDSLMQILKKDNALSMLKAIYPLRLHSDDRSSSSRLILEHLSLVI